MLGLAVSPLLLLAVLGLLSGAVGLRSCERAGALEERTKQTEIALAAERRGRAAAVRNIESACAAEIDATLAHAHRLQQALDGAAGEQRAEPPEGMACGPDTLVSW